MYWLITILAILILIPVIALIVTWRVILLYKNKEFIVKIGGVNFQFTVFSSKKAKKVKKDKYIKIRKFNFDGIKQKVLFYKSIFKEERHEVISILKTFSRAFDIIKLDISVIFGFGDAVITGIANGFVWSRLNAIVSFIEKYVDINNKTNIAIYPNYVENCFKVSFELVFDAKLYKFIGILFRIKGIYDHHKIEFEKIKEIDKNV